MEHTEHYGLKKPGVEDFYDVADFSENADAIDAALHGLEVGKAALTADGKIPAEQLPPMDYEGPLKGAPAKETPADADGVILVDAADQKTKRLLWSRVKAVLKGWFDSLYAAVGHSHTAQDVGADPTGSAAAVDSKLGSHVGSKNNPHGVTAAQVGARPSTWTPAWGDVTGKPGTFPPSGHQHGAGDISSGTLPVARGGTGATTLQSFLESLHPTSGVTSYISTFGDGWGSGGYATPQMLRSAMGLGGAVVNYIVGITIPTGGWWADTGGGYAVDIAVANMTATAPVKMDFAMTTDKAAGELMVSEFLANILRVEQMAGKVRVHTYASGKAPSVNIPVRLTWTA